MQTSNKSPPPPDYKLPLCMWALPGALTGHMTGDGVHWYSILNNAS